MDTQLNKQLVIGFLDSVERDTTKIIEYMEKTDYFKAPASTMFHLNENGGLVQHSLNVLNLFQETCSMYGFDTGELRDTIILCSLLHDLCKVDTYKKNHLANGKVSLAKPYVIEDLIPLGHGEKSLVIAQDLVELTIPEKLIIRWHMGLFDRSFLSVCDKLKEICPLAILFHTCDWNCSVFKDVKHE